MSDSRSLRRAIAALTDRLLDHYENEHPDPDMTECGYKQDIDSELVSLVKASYVPKARVPAAKDKVLSDIYNLANQYACDDPTMQGSESIRSYHYFNALETVKRRLAKGRDAR